MTDVKAEKLGRSDLIDLHPGLRAAMSEDREQYRWLEAKVAPARIVSVTQLLRCGRYRWHMQRDSYPDAGPDRAARWRMARGTILHSGLDALARHPGSERLLWHRLSPQMVVAGTPDLVLTEGAKVCVLDVKTSRTLPADGPYPGHVMQVRLYAWLLAVNGCRDRAMEGVIAYLSNADGLRGWRFDMTPYSTAEVKDLIALAERDAEPPAEPVSVWECRSCPVASCPKQGDSGRAQTDVFGNPVRKNGKDVPSAKIDFGFDTPDTAPPVRRSL